MTTNSIPPFILVFNSKNGTPVIQHSNSIESAIGRTRNEKNRVPTLVWFILRRSDGVCLAQSKQFFDNPANRFIRANEYLANVIQHPENWHDHTAAINDAIMLVEFVAESWANGTPLSI